MKKISLILILVLASFNNIFGCEDQLKGKIIDDFNEFGTYMLFEEGDQDSALYLYRTAEWMSQTSLNEILSFLKEEILLYYFLLIKSEEFTLYKNCENKLNH
jgi:hypothetical protein